MSDETGAPANPGEIAVDDSAAHLLVIDDDSRIRDLLSRYLGERGFRVTAASDAGDARRRLAGLEFDLLIVDVMMPGESGLELTRSLRETMDVPILMLTARSEIDARIQGLEFGADDYLAKPFEPRELLLRINNILKRGQPAATPLIEVVRFGPFTFNRERMELRKGTDIVHLTDRERQIMAIFAAAPGETVPRGDLVAGGGPTGERTVDVQINRLRRKIEADPANPLYLQTVRGIGYRLTIAF
ncbi:MAG: response regulator transcription factor [Bauldia sp.]|nr:response regulator transcription factor [Bauldia sp.]